MSRPARPGMDFEEASTGRRIALTARFLLEVALLAGVGVLAGRLAPAGTVWLFVIGAVLAVGMVWVLLLSPKAPYDIGETARFLVELLLFAGVGIGLFAVGLGVAAVIGFAVWAGHRIALLVLR